MTREISKPDNSSKMLQVITLSAVTRTNNKLITPKNSSSDNSYLPICHSVDFWQILVCWFKFNSLLIISDCLLVKAIKVIC